MVDDSYRFKSYQRLLEEALTDESTAGDMYRYMAGVSPDAESADALRAIAADEDRHHTILSHLLATSAMDVEEKAEYVEKMEHLLGHRHPVEKPTHRLFPKTYGDWVILAEDVKAKDPSLARSVNNWLTLIMNDEPGADDAKRQLVQKAGELGVS